MKTKILLFVSALALLTSCANSTATGAQGRPDYSQIESENQKQMEEIDGQIETLSGKSPSSNPDQTELTEAEIEGIMLMREEEKLARDVYMFLYDRWNQRIFANIARSEQMHMNAVGRLIQAYDLTDPIDGDETRGVFENFTLQKLYNTLTSQGSKTAEDAFLVGMTIEDLDIYDLQKLMQETNNEDIQRVYSHLLRGSENHMGAFYNQIEKNGFASYSPQYISQADYDKIVSSNLRGGQNHGGGRRRGRGGGGRGSK